jgi:uncharacterized protein YqjF (DUF2071 family)
MHPALREVDHRPWPLPTQAWRWRLSWLDLAFIHYRVDARSLGALLPPGIRLQEFDGSAWVGVVPFRMAGVMRRPFPDLPGLSAFHEINVRTYVIVGDKPGVWFFSLDADSWAIVFGGRRIYGLPYFSARCGHRVQDGWHEFSSVRRESAGTFVGRYRPVGEKLTHAPGSFAHWATERYCLYSFSPRRGMERVEVHHAPWPLYRAEVAIEECSLLSAAGIAPLDDTPVCHFSPGVHAVSYGTERVPAPAV